MELIMSSYINGAVASLQGGRLENQDAYCFGETPNGFLVVVCDGMGGGPGGKIASNLAKSSIAQTIMEASPNTNGIDLIKNAIMNANAAVFSASKDNVDLRGMGTTAVILLISKHSAIVGHVGDSRLYKIRMGMLVYRTNDHSLVGELVLQKTITEEQARLSTQSNILKRAIGVKPVVEPDVAEIAYEKGDRFVLCTDGVWGAMENKSFIKACSKRSNVSVLVDSLSSKIDDIGRANGGHHDNLTVAIIEPKVNSQIKEKMSKRSIGILLISLVITIICLIISVVMYNKSQAIPSLENERDKLLLDIKNRDSLISSLQADMKVAENKQKLTNGETENARYNAELKAVEIEHWKQKCNELQKKVDELTAKGTQTAKESKQIEEIRSLLEKLKNMLPNIKTSGNQSEFNSLKKQIIDKMKALPASKNYGKNVEKFTYKTPKSDVQNIIDKLK